MSAIPLSSLPSAHSPPRTRVLIVDDSAVVREMLSRALNACPDIEVVGTAPDPFVAREKIIKLSPDVITLDVEMPRMDGITFLTKLMAARPMPVIVISSLTAEGTVTSVRALQAGAVEILHKPTPNDPPNHLEKQLPALIRSAAKAKFAQPKHGPVPEPAARPTSLHRPAPVTAPPVDPRSQSTDAQHIHGPWKRIIAIGASTGGVQALTAFLTQFPEDCPPTVIVQHMPPRFTATFAERLDELCQCSVSEAREGDRLKQGHVYLAPGGIHMILRPAGHHLPNELVVSLKDGPPVFHQKPAVEVLFDSVTRLTTPATTASRIPTQAVGVILTGMGADGAAALLRMRHAGARTFAEDASTAIVYGMPAEAAKLGAAEKIAPLHDLPKMVLTAAKL